MMRYGPHKLLDTPTLQEIQPGEMKESRVEGYKGKKILVVNHGGKVYGLSTRCTHYGAPLAKGILSSDGKITCPWHGSCFNVVTGDIEDAPALDDLKVYNVVEVAGELFMDIKDGDRQPFKERGVCRPPGRKVTKSDEHTIIIGAGSGAMGCLETLVRNEYPGRISVIAKLDNVFPIDRTKLSKTLPTEEEPLNLRSKDWFDGNAIEFIWGTVGRVDFKKKTVMTDRRQTYEYTKLVIATGGKPKTISLPGFESEDDALLLRTLDDARKIKTAVGNGKKKVAIIGSSFIGLELANALSADHIVTVIGQTSAPLSHVLGEQIGDAIKRLLEKRGVRIVTRVNVSCLLGNERFPGTKFIQMKGVPGFLAADLVILAIGVVPVTDFIAKGDVGLLPDGSVKVDHHFRVVGVEDAYAVGDIATFPYWGPGAGMKSDNVYTRIEHWDVAQNSGRAVGDHIAYILENSEGEKPPKEFVPIFWSALGQQLRYCGSTLNGYDDILIRSEQPSPDTTKFVAFYTLSDTVVAVASMNWDPVVMKCVTLMKARKMPKKVDLQRGLDVMDIPI